MNYKNVQNHYSGKINKSEPLIMPFLDSLNLIDLLNMKLLLYLELSCSNAFRNYNSQNDKIHITYLYM